HDALPSSGACSPPTLCRPPRGSFTPGQPVKSQAPAGFWSGSRGPSPSWISFQLNLETKTKSFKGLRLLLNREINKRKLILGSPTFSTARRLLAYLPKHCRGLL